MVSRIGSDGPLEPGRRPARTASMSSLCARVVKSVPTARSTESSARLSLKSSRARSHQPHSGRGGLPGGTEANLALAIQPGAGIDRIVSRRRRCEAEVLHCAGDLGGLPTSAAGVENADLGVAEFGGCDVRHRRPRRLLTELGGRRSRLLRGRVTGRGLVNFRRSSQRDCPRHAGRQQQKHQRDDGGPGIASPEGPTMLVEGGTLSDLCDHECTVVARWTR